MQNDEPSPVRLKIELAELTKKLHALEEKFAELYDRNQITRQNEVILHATLDSAPFGILAVGEGGQVLFSNKEFARMWRIPPDLIEVGDDDELLQFVLDQLIEPEEFLVKVRELYESFNDSLDILRFRDGRVFERRSMPLSLEGKLSGRVWTFRDVTGQ